MSEDWAAIALEIAEALRSEFGEAHVVRKSIGASPQPHIQGTVTLELIDVAAAQTRFSTYDRMADPDIRSTDVKALVSAPPGLIITSTDMLRLGGLDYQVFNPMKVGPTGVAVLWVLRARGSK